MDQWPERPGRGGLLRSGNQFHPGAVAAIRGLRAGPYADPTPDDGWTNSFDDIKCYDQLHVQAVLNQIDGYNHDRSAKVGVPALFGTNFQSVSVGEKLAVDPVSGFKGGYTDVLGTPGQGLAGQLDFIDQSIGKFVRELRAQRLSDTTLIIISAKHGQSPIDVTKRRGIGGGQPTATIGSADAFDISDDGSLIWLTNPSLAPGVVANLSTPANQQALGIQEIFAGGSLLNKFDSPALDPRTPDIILKVNTGVIFTGRVEALRTRWLQRGRRSHRVTAVPRWYGRCRREECHLQPAGRGDDRPGVGSRSRCARSGPARSRFTCCPFCSAAGSTTAPTRSGLRSKALEASDGFDVLRERQQIEGGERT